MCEKVQYCEQCNITCDTPPPLPLPFHLPTLAQSEARIHFHVFINILNCLISASVPFSSLL